MYNDIAANKRKTWLLVACVSALLIALIWVVGRSYGLDNATSLGAGALFSFVYGLFSWFTSAPIALATSGAKEVTKAQAPELYNVVENLCIANGQPLPKIYVIDDDSPNAFATGRDPKHASIAFTTGILRLLNKTELEGVAAHELSHVKNYDIRVMTIVVVLVGAIMLIGNLFLRANIFGGKRDSDNRVGMIFMVIGLALAILSPVIAQLINFAVSRKREYLADASGALLTRYPDGLASALAKLAANNQPLRAANHATAHLFIANPFGASGKTRSFIANLFATHPPIEERIKRLQAMGK
ncbi:MAG: M48 family metallopeptidase [Patescibacteria group bacterium]